MSLSYPTVCPLASVPVAQVVLRKLFERLGATYIKLGQFIASSPTLFPAEYVLEFQKCLDKTEPVPWETVKKIIDRELGGADGVFSEINPVPLATASIAQVHTAGGHGSLQLGKAWLVLRTCPSF